MPFFADLPACRRTLGLSGHSSHEQMCSKCHLGKDRIECLNIDLFQKRSNEKHKAIAIRARDAGSYTAREKIFKTHGIRWSKLWELEYWSLIDDHVIDPMQNLLLGILAWHCKRFWNMTDADHVGSAPPPREVVELITDRIFSPGRRPLTPSKQGENAENNQDNGENIWDISFASTDPDNDNYLAPHEELDVPIATAVFDTKLLVYINQRLARIHLPTYISRAIPILGQASYGKLKADEWRNLFTIQLPLCLISLWNNKDKYQRSLLKNFCHLVSMVNIALKRTMTADRIAKYRFHNRAYLASALKLFPNRPLAPNHHMSLHIAECLERFGPVRAWWSFPFERFMGQVVKTCHNNRIAGDYVSHIIHTCLKFVSPPRTERPTQLPVLAYLKCHEA
ncbi:hypothetical protein PTTG_27047 [Puccinia triticina 1-1 BBBD Race 1]|uniref:DUF4218 domain-containing protein n=1 Tax=Puccinia triticina (isolate 1-1 / race 1 (BBBD)) TaxID=630390 RepID=A0A180GMZ3_PUCT1|nr:hypothetical protein PTTG_27047 [Puccinia triticina 1-1 BBBD Race 1]